MECNKKVAYFRSWVKLVSIIMVLVVLHAGTIYAEQQSLRAVSLNSAIEAAGGKWKAGETPVSQLSEQNQKNHLGLIETIIDSKKTALAPLPKGATLPTSLDWRNNNGNWVTSVKDQGNCGSCWAFSSTAGLESYTLRKNNTPGKDNNTPNSLDLSEQVMVSCSGAGSCNGGYINSAATFLQSSGEPVESCYPYTATNGSCSSACSTRTSAADTIKSWQWVTTSASASNVDTLRAALNTYGPIVITMAVYTDFFYYTSGIYSHTSGSLAGYHAILLVGYNDAEQSFIVKNSWGSSWGEKGYFRIAYSETSSVTQFGYQSIAYPQVGIALTPGSLTLPIGTSGTVTVSGGQAPYTATSANAGVASATLSGTNIAVTTVSTGTTSIAVKDGAGNTATVSVSVTADTAPGAPTSVTATPGNAQAAVSFTAPSSNGGSTITGYKVTSNPGGVTAAGTSSPITVSGLTNGTAYTFTVQAANAIGTGTPSAASNSVTPGVAPGAPTSVTATAGNAQAAVSFTAPSSNGGSTITGYKVTSNPGGITAAATSSPVSVFGLTNGTAYTFTVQAVNALGTGAASSASNSVTPSVSVPGAPTAVTATAGNAQATVSFAAPSSNGGGTITSYTVTSSPSGKTAAGISSPVTVTGLTNGTAYTFTVKAANSAGTGAASSASNSVTPASTIAPFNVAVAGGLYHTVALKNDGSVWAWGYNYAGALGNGTTTDSRVPVQVSGLSGVVSIAAGAYHTIALKSDGTVWTWGYNGAGELCNGSYTSSSTPVQISGLSGVTAIAGGFYNTIALKSDGTVWSCGYGSDGELGNGSNSYTVNKPVQVSNLTAVAAIAGGSYHTLALKGDGSVWSWGYNGSGELGNGTTKNSNIPVLVNGLSGVTTVAGGAYHSAAIKGSGNIWAWGNNGNGELGIGSYTNATTPVQVSNLTGVTAIAAGYYHTLAVKSDGTIWAMGYGGYGEIGNGTYGTYSTPTKVSMTGGVSVAAGCVHSIALKSDWTVWDWGYNGYGALGNGSTSAYSNIPVQAAFGNTKSYTVTPSAGANGSISPASAFSVVSGKTASFTVTPNAGYTASVSGTCGGTLSGNVYTTNAIKDSCTVVASFTLTKVTATPSVSGANGSISPAAPWTVDYGTKLRFSVTPNSGYTASVAGTCGGTLSGTDYTTNAITSNCTVVASFTASKTSSYTVTPSAGANGSISPAAAQSVASGATKQFTITPASGYVAMMSGTCGGSLSGNVYTTNAITSNCTVVANFVASTATFNVIPSAGAHGTISPATTVTVTAGKTASFTVTPDAGYYASVGGGCNGTLSGNVYTTNPVVYGNCTVTAYFYPKSSAAAASAN
ncbi:MAG: fibronectin type III domain-containing protein [Candidatus Magnetominusculus sp. LBB02]|nr:fibronectin type III domain-containing protein [Candidatus Magnetominusculus sp. LBB02]